MPISANKPIGNAHHGPLPYIQFGSHTWFFIVGGNECIVPKAAARKELPCESVHSSGVASPSLSSTGHCMASHNSCETSLFRECFIIVLVADGP